MAALGLLLRPAWGVRFLAAVPVLLDAGDEFSARQRALPAVDGAELHAVLDPASDARPRPLSAWRDLVQHLDAEHADNLDCRDRDLAVLRAARRLRPVAPQLPLRRQSGHRHLYHLPGAADAPLYSARRYHPQLSSGRHAVGADPHLSDLPHPVLHLAADGLLQGDPEGARGMRADRRRD